jgi:hypothetical protein
VPTANFVAMRLDTNFAPLGMRPIAPNAFLSRVGVLQRCRMPKSKSCGRVIAVK